MNTDGGMKRSRQKVDNVRQKRASLVDKEGTEFGWQSEIEGIVADNPRKVRGDRCERLILEECFAPGTPVLMADYSRRNIEDIKVGDYVMGIDGTPQKVVNTCGGIDQMYLVHQRKGLDYKVNSHHKLYTE